MIKNLFSRPADARTKALVRDLAEACDRLNALRRNCFLTNEKGHRVRYFEASDAVRRRAEGN